MWSFKIFWNSRLATLLLSSFFCLVMILHNIFPKKYGLYLLVLYYSCKSRIHRLRYILFWVIINPNNYLSSEILFGDDIVLKTWCSQKIWFRNFIFHVNTFRVFIAFQYYGPLFLYEYKFEIILFFFLIFSDSVLCGYLS